MENFGITDVFVEEKILEVATFMSLQGESYQIISDSSFSLYIQSLNHLADENFEDSLALLKSGSMKGNPYCQYSLFTIFASNNQFGVPKNKDFALYLLICSALNFTLGLLPEDSAHKMLYIYITKHDDIKKTMCLSLLADFQDSITNFRDKKDIAIALFRMMMYNTVENREELRKCLTKYNDPEDYFIALAKLRLGHIEDAEKLIDSEMFERFLENYCYELLLYFTRTGVMDCENLCLAIKNSFIIIFYYLIFKGKNISLDQDLLLLEMMEFCNMLTQESKMKTNEYEEEGKAIFESLKPIIYLINAYFLLNNKYYARNVEKAAELIKKFEKFEGLNKQFELLADFLYLKCYHKLYKYTGAPKNIDEMFQKFLEHYNHDKLSVQNSKVIEFYIAGYIHEIHLKNKQDARAFYQKGLDVVFDQEDEYLELMCYHAFRKKCSSKAFLQSNIDLLD